MKKILMIALAWIAVMSVQAQDFDRYFENKTLRINYLHTGDAQSEKFTLKEYHAGGVWSGTRAFLMEPNRYGDILIEVFDSISGVPVFSRSYDCLFNECRATEEAKTVTRDFQECINIPFPKQTIKYTITCFNRLGVGTVLFAGYFNPKSTPTVPFSDDYTTVTLHQGGAPEKCLDILFVPDGYSKADAELLDKDLKDFTSYVLDCSPYKENKNRFNIHAVKCYSQESGITDPNKGIRRNTAIGCSYNTINTDRYLMCENVWLLYDVSDDTPFDVIVILCNSKKYGGGGIFNFYATVCNGAPEANFVVVHEMGHLIGGLADEYDANGSGEDYFPAGVEPKEPNVTTLVDFGSKWKFMMDPKTPIPTPETPEYNGKLGVYEGAGYVGEGVYRPWLDCSMKDIIYDNFCPVCTKVLIEIFDYYSNRESK
ncbi:MAG: peptidase M64 [Bacteroidales bacterium]|nr:peptidase M64 [Bacteroidales bacterium]